MKKRHYNFYILSFCLAFSGIVQAQECGAPLGFAAMKASLESNPSLIRVNNMGEVGKIQNVGRTTRSVKLEENVSLVGVLAHQTQGVALVDKQDVLNIPQLESVAINAVNTRISNGQITLNPIPHEFPILANGVSWQVNDLAQWLLSLSDTDLSNAAKLGQIGSCRLLSRTNIINPTLRDSFSCNLMVTRRVVDSNPSTRLRCVPRATLRLGGTFKCPDGLHVSICKLANVQVSAAGMLKAQIRTSLTSYTGGNSDQCNLAGVVAKLNAISTRASLDQLISGTASGGGISFFESSASGIQCFMGIPSDQSSLFPSNMVVSHNGQFLVSLPHKACNFAYYRAARGAIGTAIPTIEPLPSGVTIAPPGPPQDTAVPISVTQAAAALDNKYIADHNFQVTDITSHWGDAAIASKKQVDFSLVSASASGKLAVIKSTATPVETLVSPPCGGGL